jgi:hypothetical protein
VYVSTCSLQYRDAGRAKEIKKIGTAVNAACQGNLSACHFGHARRKYASHEERNKSNGSARIKGERGKKILTVVM